MKSKFLLRTVKRFSWALWIFIQLRSFSILVTRIVTPPTRVPHKISQLRLMKSIVFSNYLQKFELLGISVSGNQESNCSSYSVPRIEKLLNWIKIHKVTEKRLAVLNKNWVWFHEVSRCLELFEKFPDCWANSLFETVPVSVDAWKFRSATNMSIS